MIQLSDAYTIDMTRIFTTLQSQNIVFLVETLSLLLQAALKFDNKGFSVHIVPVILNSFLNLYVSLSKMEELLQKYYLLCPIEKLQMMNKHTDQR